MIRLFLAFISVCALCLGNGDENVNSKYKVESIELSRPIDKRISRSLREEVDSLVGRNFDASAVSDIATRLHKELKLIVGYRVERGLQPEHVKVVFDAKRRRWDEDDAKVTKLTYHQKQGWTAGLEVGFDAGPNRFEVGWQSDADRLLERFQGWNAGWGLQIHDRVRFRFDVEGLRQTWNPATEAFASPLALYRERATATPTVTVMLVPGLSLNAGVTVQHLSFADATVAANAVVAGLRYRTAEGSKPRIEAGYGVRAANGGLGSDYVYARHTADAAVYVDNGHHHVVVRGMTGGIGGEAPLFERFSLGDTHTLRGWNKFDVEPLGGARMAHASAGYRYRSIGVFYDTGSVWDRNETAKVRHSVGVTVATRDGPYVTVAFPLRDGHYVPLFMMGMNF